MTNSTLPSVSNILNDAVLQKTTHLSTKSKNALLGEFAKNLHAHKDTISDANKKDISNATELSVSLRERLTFQHKEIDGTIDAIKQIIALPDPIGTIDQLNTMPSGIRVGKMRIPLGVILMVYESRPNVTADAASLAIKSGNVAVLRGGSEAQFSNNAIYQCLKSALQNHGVAGRVHVLQDYNRDIITQLLQAEDVFDMVIPRGGRQLIEHICQTTKIPVLKHLDGNCHVYIDQSADINMAVSIVINSKTRRYSVCNAAESLLVHADIAPAFLPPVAAALSDKAVEIRGCSKTLALLNNANIKCQPATAEDWATEYLAPIISIKIVDNLDEAIAHINTHGSGHTDAIVTNNTRASWRFLQQVDSSSVITNAATGFADGGEYGLGCEVGISTNRLHARGPVGLEGLTTQKYIVLGQGECR